MNKKNRSLSFFLAIRYLQTSAWQSSLSTMTKICFVSMIIGAFSLTLVSAIMNGFESAIHDKLRGIHPHITIESDGQELAVDAIDQVILSEFAQVTATSPMIIKHALIYAPDTKGTPLIAMLKGIDPHREQKTTSIATKIIAGNAQLEKSIHGNSVIIGKEMATQLGVTIGDPLTLAYSNDLGEKKRSVSFDTQLLKVTGIFQTGVEDFDSSCLFCHYELVKKIFDDAPITTLNLAIKNGVCADDIAGKIEQRFKLPAYSWKSLYPALIAALALEKYAMFWILALITLVASSNIIALLYMIITQKKGDIALLRTLGSSRTMIRSIFIIIGSLIANSACLVGIILAWFASFLINRYKLIALPDSYYVSHLYADMNLSIAFAVFSVVFVITLCATFVATRNIYYGKITDIMRP